MPLKDLQKYLKDNPQVLIFGSKQSIKQIKLDKVREVFLAGDCHEQIQERILNYSKFSDLRFDKLEENKEELSLICGKGFPISIIGVLSTEDTEEEK